MLCNERLDIISVVDISDIVQKPIGITTYLAEESIKNKMIGLSRKFLERAFDIWKTCTGKKVALGGLDASLFTDVATDNMFKGLIKTLLHTELRKLSAVERV